MKIFLTGGGTGGHFYPIIAVADSLSFIAEQEKIAKLDIVFASESSYDANLLKEMGIRFKQVSGGKIRRYFSFLNFLDIFKTFYGTLKALWAIYFDFPDVIFSKGGYSSFPIVFAARFFGIPIVIHESDAAPGKVNAWSGKFARRIAISFPETAKYFPAGKAVLTGNPIRRELFFPAKTGAKEFLKLEDNVPIILVIGGSQGAQKINDNILDVTPNLIERYQIIHQCGKNNFEEVRGRASILLDKSSYRSRYHFFSYLDISALRMAYGAADIVISRAGSGSIFEIAASGLPSILIPITNSAQDHQRINAYAYASTGAADIIEEKNLTPVILRGEIDRLLGNKEKLQKMSVATKDFAKSDAAEKIAREIINLALEHA